MTNSNLTGIFKLHNLSQHKRAILDHVMVEYTCGVGEVLRQAEANLDVIGEQAKLVSKDGEVLAKYKHFTVSRFLPKASELQSIISSNLKESLIDDVSAMLASHLALRLGESGQVPGYPVARDPSPEGYPHALADLAAFTGDPAEMKVWLADENELFKALLKRVKSNVMPLSLSRSRDGRLLYDRKNGRFFLWCRLLPDKHPLGVYSAVVDQDNLIDLNTGEIFKQKGRTAILLPLEVGRRGDDWHWQYHKFIEPLMRGEISLKSSKLVKRDEKKGAKYFWHVSFEIPDADRYKPKTFLGIDRGVFFSMAYAIVNNKGAIIEMSHKDDGFRHERIAAGKRVQQKQQAGRQVTARDYRQKQLDSILHSLINDILDKAEKHRSMIVCEDLNIQIKAKFYKSAWKKMYNLLAYKCKLRGIPLWKNGIWAAYSSQICIICGELNKWRKRDGSPFVCGECGAIYHSDEGAGVNIARRAMYRKKQWQKRGGYRGFHSSFAKTLNSRAKNDLRKVGIGFAE